MSRRNDGAAEAAAAAASEAARVLQARREETREPEKRETLHVKRPEPKADDKSETPPAPVKRGNPDRDAIMEGIRRARGEREPEEEPTPTTAPETPIETPTAAETPTEKPTATPPVETPAPIPAMVKVKVDGEEFEVPQAEVDEAGGLGPYRIMRAAENRLRKANQTLAESQRVAASLQQQQQPPPPARPSDKEVFAKLAAARFGTDEEYSAAVEDALSLGRVDPNGIVRQAVNQVQRAQAMAGFQQEFADVTTNPMALRLAVSLENELDSKLQQAERQGQLQGPVDWQKIYRTIGTQVRNAFGGPARQSQPAAPNVVAATTATTQPGNPSPVSEKEARKASIVTLPTAAARADLPEDPKPETREESLNRMRTRRGLPTV